MAAGAHDRISGRGITGGHGTRRFRPQIHRGKKLGGGSGVGEVAGGRRRKLGTRAGRIEGHGDRIEGNDEWIIVCGHRIRRVGLRINNHGEVYVPDSEDEDVMEDVTSKAPAGMEVAAEGATGKEVAADEAARMASEELPPKVQACLEKVLAGMDLVYHNFFISMYKVMVPALFKCN